MSPFVLAFDSTFMSLSFCSHLAEHPGIVGQLVRHARHGVPASTLRETANISTPPISLFFLIEGLSQDGRAPRRVCCEPTTTTALALTLSSNMNRRHVKVTRASTPICQSSICLPVFFYQRASAPRLFIPAAMPHPATPPSSFIIHDGRLRFSPSYSSGGCQCNRSAAGYSARPELKAHERQERHRARTVGQRQSLHNWVSKQQRRKPQRRSPPFSTLPVHATARDRCGRRMQWGMSNDGNWWFLQTANSDPFLAPGVDLEEGCLVSGDSRPFEWIIFPGSDDPPMHSCVVSPPKLPA